MSTELQQIFSSQKEFCKKLFKENYNIDFDNLCYEDKIKWTKEYVLSIMIESGEVLNELKWKKHRFIAQQENIDNLLEETVDVLKFLINIVIMHGYNEKDFFQKFVDKTKVVSIRYEQEKKLKELKDKKDVKLAVIDIDGIICNHSGTFLEGCTYKTIYDYKNNDINAYNKNKYAFRVSGQKRNAKIMPGALEFLYKLKQNGYLILLLTARPYEKIIRIYADTLHWLEKNNVHYDFLFFNKNKEQFIIDNLSPEQVKFCLDDDIENVNKLVLYFTTYLMPNYTLYDRREIVKVRQNVRIVDSFDDIKL